MGEEDQDMKKLVPEFINKHSTSPWCYFTEIPPVHRRFFSQDQLGVRPKAE